MVDDEPLVRGELVYALGRVAGDWTIEEADSAAGALARLASGGFDVVFLDINLPGMSGLEAMTVINNLPQRPHVVLVTAYGAHALKAFELAATDYLVKPVSEERLAMTIARLRNDAPDAVPEPNIPTGGRLPLDDGDRTLLVRIADIRFVHAEGHIVLAKLNDAELRYRGTLSECAARLEPLGFLRVHRSFLVNPEHVIEIEPFFGGTYVLRLADKQRSEAPVSRNYLPIVKRAFGL